MDDTQHSWSTLDSSWISMDWMPRDQPVNNDDDEIPAELPARVHHGLNERLGEEPLSPEETQSFWLSQAEYDAKREEIDACLNGYNQGGKDVDLWRLRSFALTKGGFLCPKVRKRAWPKLFGVHQQVLKKRKIMSVEATSTIDEESLLRDVSRTKWRVEEYLDRVETTQSELEEVQLDVLLEKHPQRLFYEQRDTQHHQQLQEQVYQQQLEQQPLQLEPVPPEHEREEPRTPPPALQSLGEACSSPESPESPLRISMRYPDTNSTGVANKANSAPSIPAPPTPALDPYTGFPKSPLAIGQPTPYEANLLYTIISSASGVRHYPGLQDLVAASLLNLESPSMTRLLLERMATHHWNIDNDFSPILYALLQMVDPILHQQLDNDPDWSVKICRECCAPWFAQTIENPAALSRLLDFLLVSHPIMPAYVAVAIITVNRRILASRTDQRLGLDIYSLDSVERIVQQAAQYMQEVPPRELLVSMDMIPAVAQRGSPDWMAWSTAPTDSEWLREAHQMRQIEAQQCMGEEHCADEHDSGNPVIMVEHDDNVLSKLVDPEQASHPIIPISGTVIRDTGFDSDRPRVYLRISLWIVSLSTLGWLFGPFSTVGHGWNRTSDVSIPTAISLGQLAYKDYSTSSPQVSEDTAALSEATTESLLYDDVSLWTTAPYVLRSWLHPDDRLAMFPSSSRLQVHRTVNNPCGLDQCVPSSNDTKVSSLDEAEQVPKKSNQKSSLIEQTQNVGPNPPTLRLLPVSEPFAPTELLSDSPRGKFFHDQEESPTAVGVVNQVGKTDESDPKPQNPTGEHSVDEAVPRTQNASQSLSEHAHNLRNQTEPQETPPSSDPKSQTRKSEGSLDESAQRMENTSRASSFIGRTQALLNQPDAQDVSTNTTQESVAYAADEQVPHPPAQQPLPESEHLMCEELPSDAPHRKFWHDQEELPQVALVVVQVEKPHPSDPRSQTTLGDHCSDEVGQGMKRSCEASSLSERTQYLRNQPDAPDVSISMTKEPVDAMDEQGPQPPSQHLLPESEPLMREELPSDAPHRKLGHDQEDSPLALVEAQAENPHPPNSQLLPGERYSDETAADSCEASSLSELTHKLRNKPDAKDESTKMTQETMVYYKDNEVPKSLVQQLLSSERDELLSDAPLRIPRHDQEELPKVALVVAQAAQAENPDPSDSTSQTSLGERSSDEAEQGMKNSCEASSLSELTQNIRNQADAQDFSTYITQEFPTDEGFTPESELENPVLAHFFQEPASIHPETSILEKPVSAEVESAISFVSIDQEAVREGHPVVYSSDGEVPVGGSKLTVPGSSECMRGSVSQHFLSTGVLVEGVEENKVNIEHTEREASCRNSLVDLISQVTSTSLEYVGVSNLSLFNAPVACPVEGSGPLKTGEDGGLYLKLTSVPSIGGRLEILKEKIGSDGKDLKNQIENNQLGKVEGNPGNDEINGDATIQNMLLRLPLQAGRQVLSTSFPLSMWLLLL